MKIERRSTTRRQTTHPIPAILILPRSAAVSSFDQPHVEKSGAFHPVRALRLVFDTAALRKMRIAGAILTLICLAAVPLRAAEDTPVFQEIPGVTQPLPAQPMLAAIETPSEIVVEPATLTPEVPEDKTVFSFQASALDLRTALATFARANNLNIVPDNDITGTVTLDVRDLQLDHMMRALLEASDCSWQEEGGLIRVRNTDTRTFFIDYLRLSRKGIGQNSATLGSGTAGGAGGGGAGGSGGGGGGGGGGGSSGGGGTAFSASSSTVNVSADNPVDFWQELTAELAFMLTPAGKSSMAINRTAGIIQVTDRPSALKRVESYLKGVDNSVHRQVEIEARLYDVTLNDQFQFGIDWVHVAKAYGGAMSFGTATLPVPVGGSQLLDSSLGGLNRVGVVGTPGSAIPGGNLTSLAFKNMNTEVAINALQMQGNVEVISTPRIRVLNNQTALIKVGVETPFFAQFFESQQSQSGNVTTSGDQITSITVGTILSITPQISNDDWVTLDITPVLTSLVDTRSSPSGSATAPVLDTKQASTLIRVRDGTTVVMGGLIQTQEAKNDKKVPLLGDIPFLGKLFTGTYRHNEKKELVIFVTPRIISINETSVSSDFSSRVNPPVAQ
jgi:MSHA biogenesis protein MshL